MLSKKSLAIKVINVLTAVFLVFMFYNTIDKMIYSNDNENSLVKTEEISSHLVEKDKNGKTLTGNNLKNIKNPSFSLYFLAIFLGFACSSKEFMKIGIW